MYILAIIEMKTIIIPVHTIINSYSIDMHLFAFQNTYTMISAGCKKSILKKQIVALVKNKKMRTIEVSTNTVLSRASIISFAIIKCKAISIYRSFSFN